VSLFLLVLLLFGCNEIKLPEAILVLQVGLVDAETPVLENKAQKVLEVGPVPYLSVVNGLQEGSFGMLAPKHHQGWTGAGGLLNGKGVYPFEGSYGFFSWGQIAHKGLGVMVSYLHANLDEPAGLDALDVYLL